MAQAPEENVHDALQEQYAVYVCVYIYIYVYLVLQYKDYFCVTF